MCARQLRILCFLGALPCLRARAGLIRKATLGQARDFEVPLGRCSCDVRMLECLPEADCLAQMIGEERSRVARGVELRKRLRRSITWEPGGREQSVFWQPVGKAMQYGNIEAWKHWVASEQMASEFDASHNNFIAESQYEYCRVHHLVGKQCFFRPFTSEENLGELERVAVAHAQDNATEAGTQATYEDLVQLRGSQLKDQSSLPADRYLLSFAHMSRIRFNLQPTIEKAYDQRLAELNPGKGSLRVALHIRRADSCNSTQADYAKEARPSNATAQVTGQRACFATTVYVNALRRIRDLYNKPLCVYLATDDSHSVLEEIRAAGPDVYHASTWRHLNYSRAAFAYTDTIEFVKDSSKQGFLGETGIADLWHLSHGEVFLGHLGSRFGKMGYLLAVARHNAPLPYVTVDGHSLCCEIDEVCSTAVEKMRGMVDCLLYAHERDAAPVNANYWQAGSTVRKTYGLL